MDQNYADVKLKRNNRVISIGTALNGIKVRDKVVEVDPTLLFMRVTCIIEKQAEMEDYLQHRNILGNRIPKRPDMGPATSLEALNDPFDAIQLLEEKLSTKLDNILANQEPK